MTDIDKNRKAIAAWLIVVCITIFLMVIVGGVTRLTNSGLSMVDWKPIMGVIPPLNETEWMETFEKYKQFPEYQKRNQHMDVEGFKSIFYWEYGHRLLGRLIGVIFFVPFVYFLVRGKIEKPFVSKLVIALVLGGLQGLMGWYMVKSGLVDMPRVSHYRLAAHLLLALLIFSWLFWVIKDLLWPKEFRGSLQLPGWWNRVAISLLVLVVIQITYGAFTAGIRAGFGYNTFPLMNDQWVADAVFMLDPWWINFFEGVASIQFLHRWIGTLLLLVVGLLWLAITCGKSDQRIKSAAHWLFGVTLAQFLTGVLTLVYVVPIGLAALHQAIACLLLLASVNLVYLGWQKK
ncbi:MAG: COX15/CtaA family protein [Gammaproteobacteria bacterium]|nr:COX15/CtaA family protein [Gammaproteobacteria bacterium]